MLLFLLGISLVCPLLIFFDYRKRSNVYMAIVYVLAFIVTLFLFSKTSDAFKLVFAASVPVLMVIFLFIAKKRKGTGRKKRGDQRVIDDL